MAELFQNFEVNRTPRWPRLLRTAAGSVVVHGLFIAAVLYMSTVQSMYHLASRFSGAEYVDEEYGRTQIREKVHVVKLAPYEKLYYPPGYFSKEVAPLPPTPAAVLVEEVRPRPTPTPKPTPSPTPEATPTPTTESSSEEVADADQKPGGGGVGAEATPEAAAGEPKTDADVNKLAEETKTKRLPKINVKPFKDLLAEGKEMMDKGRIDLKGTIELTVEADRNDDGTLTDVEITGGSSSDPELKILAMKFIEALSASKALSVLEDARHLRMTLKSDPKGIGVTVLTEVDSAARAAEMARGYGGMLAFGRLIKSGKDEGEIWKSMSVSSSGKQVTMKFQMPREAASKMLAKQLPQKT